MLQGTHGTDQNSVRKAVDDFGLVGFQFGQIDQISLQRIVPKDLHILLLLRRAIIFDYHAFFVQTQIDAILLV